MTDVAVYLLPGMQAKIIVSDIYVGYGERVFQTSSGEDKTYDITDYNGFLVENKEVGDIEAVPNEPAVIYTHKKYEQNKIVFFGRNPEETCTVNVISVPIHDHSSIVTGGPAYATYFTDDETVTED